MMSLVPLMLRARRGQAVAVFLLSAVAVAAAIAGPVALSAVDAAVVRNEVSHASVQDLSISVSAAVDPSNPDAEERFTTTTNLLRPVGFSMIRGGELTTFPAFAPDQTPNDQDTTRVVFRDGVCAHIVITSGRCVAGTYEVVLSEAVAKATGLRAGTVAIMQSASYDRIQRKQVADGSPVPVTVAGLYHPRDANELYWGTHNFFSVTPAGLHIDPVFTNAPTFDLIDHRSSVSTADAVSTPALFTQSRLRTLKSDVDYVIQGSRSDDGGGLVVNTTIPQMVDRIDTGQQLAHQLVPVAFVPLVGLCWYVVFLTVGYGLTGRRREVGLVSLRGVDRLRRWWLATGETLTAILAGAPAGYLLGYAALAVFARLQLGVANSPLSTASLPYAAIALSGALIVAILGQRRVLSTPVLDLLRGVPARTTAWRSFAIELVVVALAVVGVLQLRGGPQGLTGVGLLVPGLVLAAVAVLAARLFTPVAALLARIALRRGWLGSGLAAIQVARRPGSQRLFVLLAAAVGLLAFDASAVSVAALGRDERSAVLAGASTVATVDQTTADRILAVTHAVDPGGRWAMAAQPVSQQDTGAPPELAIDADRLAAVVGWRSEYGVSPQAITTALRPPATHPMILRDPEVTVDIGRTADRGMPAAAMSLKFESLSDGTAVIGILEVEQGTRQRYKVPVPACAAGCRLTGFTIDGGQDAAVNLIVYGLTAASGPVAGPAELSQADRWAGSIGASLSPQPDGLHLASESPFFLQLGPTVTALDAPLPVPVASTQADIAGITTLDGSRVQAKPAVHAALLPRLGGRGTLVDLGYLRSVGLAASASSDGQVWLGPAAPPDAVARLRRAGLAITGVSSVDSGRAALARSGPALALQFHLAAAWLGIVLALGGFGLFAAVDRRPRSGDLRALRRQGLPRRYARRAALWAYLSLVVGAALAGLAAAAIAWSLTGAALPMFTEKLVALPPPAWPQVDAVLRPWALATAGLIVAAVAAAWLLRVAVARGPAVGHRRPGGVMPEPDGIIADTHRRLGKEKG